MSWRQPKYLFGLGMDDQLMMQEILELLAMDSPDNTPERIVSTTASSRTNRNSSHGSVRTDLNRSSGYGPSDNESLNEEMKKIVDLSSADDVGSLESWGCSVKETCSDKETSPAGQEAVQQRAESAVDFAQQTQTQTQMQNSMPSSLMPLAHAASTRLPIIPSYAPTHQPYAGDRRGVSAASTMNLPPALSSAPVRIAASKSEVPSNPRGSSAPSSQKKKLPSTSNVLPTGQRVHLMNSAEFNELRRKLRMQTTSRRYRKRRKEQSRHQKMQVQELQAELARLHEYETQWKQYQQRSVESLQNELEMHENEVASLTEKIQDAAKEELD